MNSRALGTMSVLALALALSACGGNKSSSSVSRGDASPAVAPTIDCNGEPPVWTLSSPKVYLVPGDRHYGKTKRGRYLCRSQAHAEGYRPAHHPFRQGEHHRRNEQ